MAVSPKWAEVLKLLSKVKPNLAARLGGMKVASDAGWEIQVVPPVAEAASLQRELLAEQSLLDELIAQVYRQNKSVALAPPEAAVVPPDRPAAEADDSSGAGRDESLRRTFSMGQDLLRNKQFARAQPLLQKVVELEPTNVTARFALAECLARLEKPAESQGVLVGGAELCLAQGNLEDAEGLAARAARDGALQGTVLLGLVAVERDNLRDAERHFQDVLKKVPGHPAAKLNLARCHARRGNAERAVELYRELVARHPGDMDATVELGETQAQLGQKREAADTFAKVASFFARQRQLDRAAAFAHLAVGQDPSNLDAHHQLVSAYFYQGRKEDLLFEYGELLQLYDEQGMGDEVERVKRKMEDLARVVGRSAGPAEPSAHAERPESAEELSPRIEPAAPAPEGAARFPADGGASAAAASEPVSSAPERSPPPAAYRSPEPVAAAAEDAPAEAPSLGVTDGASQPLPPDFLERPAASYVERLYSPPEPTGAVDAGAAPAVSMWTSETDEPTVDEMLTDFARLFRETKRLRRLREIDEIKTATVYTIVEEVRRMLGWSKALFAVESERMAQFPPETQELFYQIAAKSPLLERLCEDLIEFTELVSEDYAVPVEDADLVAVAQEALAEVRALATVKQISLEFECERDEVRFSFDPAQIRSAIRHLVANSVKFTPKGGTVSVEVVPDAEQVQVTVRDTGKPVRADPGSVFLRFRGVSDSLSGKIKGRGIRMPILQSIIEAHGGRLVIQGEEGVGNRFSFTLPRSGPAARATGGGDAS